MKIEREKRWWLVSMSYDERAELYTNGDFPPERAIAAVVYREGATSISCKFGSARSRRRGRSCRPQRS